MEEKKKSGGRRPGAGRPVNNRNILIAVRISQDAADILNTQKNKSEYIDELIKKNQ